MSNTNNNNMQTQTSNALHNVIMEVGGKDRHPMLAPDKMEMKDIISSCLSHFTSLLDDLKDFGRVATFKRTFSQDMDLLEKHLTKEILHEIDYKTALTKIRTMVKDYTYHKEKMLLCKQAEKGVPLQVEQADWLEDTDEEIDEQELEAHYSYMAKIQEVLVADSRTDIEALEHVQYDIKYNVFANAK
ncbi:hypothetical protein Tco_0853964 [Tanacetum coccineum]